MKQGVKMKFKKLIVTMGLFTIASLSGCQSMGGANRAGTDRLIASCATGAILGAVAGNAIDGKKGRDKGAAAGLALGCGIGMALNHRDKERIRQAQLRALKTNRKTTDSWKGDDGKMRRVDVSTIQVAPQANRVCRRVQSRVQISGKDGAADIKDIYCRTPEGDWALA